MLSVPKGECVGRDAGGVGSTAMFKKTACDGGQIFR